MQRKQVLAETTEVELAQPVTFPLTIEPQEL